MNAPDEPKGDNTDTDIDASQKRVPPRTPPRLREEMMMNTGAWRGSPSLPFPRTACAIFLTVCLWGLFCLPAPLP
ncbi:MAG: hypothetical protein P8010_13895, partial [Desulfosarcinaceae bacterium]